MQFGVATFMKLTELLRLEHSALIGDRLGTIVTQISKWESNE
jgi:hypothetical protein